MNQFSLWVCLLLLLISPLAWASAERIVYSQDPNNCGVTGACGYEVLDSGGRILFSGLSHGEPWFMRVGHGGHKDFCANEATFEGTSIQEVCYGYDALEGSYVALSQLNEETTPLDNQYVPRATENDLEDAPNLTGFNPFWDIPQVVYHDFKTGYVKACTLRCEQQQGVDPTVCLSSCTESLHNLEKPLPLAGITVFTALVYFVPFLLACILKKNNKPAILIINLFFGWSGLGWLIALIMAVWQKQPAIQPIISGEQPESFTKSIYKP